MYIMRIGETRERGAGTAYSKWRGPSAPGTRRQGGPRVRDDVVKDGLVFPAGRYAAGSPEGSGISDPQV
jgi:hypothetical protein